ncbi:hypothetical protein [Tengunoibacter tsumagoiensis]|uniref:Uncharacterized protein n=1 Tax=Tengunoibacter tsumagoiensis TaxID=2014871 RepID=A0A401ZWI0_9CHLR|nr:hypothetical protein [Tengunoibacter tsumagoiensis]GCE11217.1 hypothetical protein KTT_10760 [Tengunoibacter tsumagoiensis]
MAKTKQNKAAASIQNVDKKKQKKLTRIETKLQSRIAETRKKVKKAQKRLARTQADLLSGQERLNQLEQKLHKIHPVSATENDANQPAYSPDPEQPTFGDDEEVEHIISADTLISIEISEDYPGSSDEGADLASTSPENVSQEVSPTQEELVSEFDLASPPPAEGTDELPHEPFTGTPSHTDFQPTIAGAEIPSEEAPSIPHEDDAIAEADHTSLAPAEGNGASENPGADRVSTPENEPLSSSDQSSSTPKRPTTRRRTRNTTPKL